MKETIRTVNDQGMFEIKEFLSAKHKLGGQHFDRDMLRAWAADAEFQLAEGNDASIEIRSFGAISGHTETFTISPAGLDTEEIEVQE
jgi:hypothetical protein